VGADEVHDGFGLDEIDASVEESAAGELTGISGPGAGVEAGAEDASCGGGAAVALEFDNIFCGVTFWFPKY
jgi:hypothetical protein